MNTQERNGRLTITSSHYVAQFIPERLLAVLRQGSLYYGMSLLSAIDTLDRCDTDKRAPELVVAEKTASRVHVQLRADSSIWRKKVHHYLFHEDHVEYWTRWRARAP